MFTSVHVPYNANNAQSELTARWQHCCAVKVLALSSDGSKL